MEAFIPRSTNPAEEVLNRLQKIIVQYDFATVADLKDLLGDPTTFADNNVGWRDLTEATALEVENGYKVILPEPVEVP